MSVCGVRCVCVDDMVFFFFFSSRRRHTRFDCDWSSDVCSSDLFLTAGLVAHTLGADGAVFTKIGGGAPHVDMAQAAAQCEALGVKTTLVVEDMSTDGAAEGMLLFDFPGMDALVNVGCGQESLVLPPMDRVIGADDLASTLLGESRATYGTLGGAIEQVGATKVMA